MIGILFLVALAQASSLNLTASTCQTKINTLQGQCIPYSSCQGGVYNGLCTGSGKCCVPDQTGIPPVTNMYLTRDQFRNIFKSVSSERTNVLYPWFNKALGILITQIDNNRQCAITAAFAAQVGHESVDLLYFEELASGEAYEGRCIDLGNCQKGDGVKYKGRGAIQVTGRSNYKRVSDYFKNDFVSKPELLVLPSHGFNSAVWFWTVNNLNRFCDGTTDSFKKLTRTINGGYNGLDDRLNRWNNARNVLGC
jgi:putative chitinase